MEITLSKDQQQVDIKDPFFEINEVTLNCGDVIDFKASDIPRVFSGMIERFVSRKDMDGAVWMTIKETTGERGSESISILNWKNNVNDGFVKY